MESVNKYKYTRAYFKIKELILNNPNEDVFVIRGGQGASKTVSIIELIIQSLLSSEKEATILSSELSKMKRTVIRDYKKICKDWGVFKSDDDFNRSESKHEYSNGSYLDFLGADVTDVGKGFRRDILYINEADKMDIETAVQFISRAGITIIDYNPDKYFWGDDYINDNNFLTLTFEDNEYLSKSEVRSILDYGLKGFHDINAADLFNESNIKSKYWANKWKVYGLGLVGSLEGVIFNNWTQCDNIPAGAELFSYGLDWGFTNDPTALSAFYKYEGKIYIDELIYRTSMTNSMIVSEMQTLGVSRHTPIVADSAEPKSITDLSNAGFYVIPAKKGPDSIRNGIDILQEYDIVVTSRSVNTIKELNNYKWAVDKSGKSLNTPISSWNHSIDEWRYVASEFLPVHQNLGIYSFS